LAGIIRLLALVAWGGDHRRSIDDTQSSAGDESSSAVSAEFAGIPESFREAETMSSERIATTVNPTALPLADAARILSHAFGRPITERMLHDDIGDGAPANPDGTINLVHYAAWLAKEMGRGD
jgi:hypothetical protein